MHLLPNPQSFIVILLFVVSIGTSFFANSAQRTPHAAPNYRPPPQVAFDVCSDAKSNDQCSVSTPIGEQLIGRCRTPPQIERLVCVPDRHHQQKGQGRPSDSEND